MKAPPPGGKLYEQAGKSICIMDPEFRNLLAPLGKKELAQLEENLVADGRVIDPIVVWQEEMILLDGHNRLPIALEKDLNFTMVRKNFATRAEAIKWVLDHQLGRRNLSPAGQQKARALRRERVREAIKSGKSERTIAKEEKVTPATVHRDVEATGASYEAPDKVAGADGKKYPSRTGRLGLGYTPPPPKIGREPGDDTDQIKNDKKEARTAPKSGKALFDWKAFNKHFAGCMLEIARFSKAYDCFKTDQRKALTQHLDDVKKEFMTWYKAVAKQRAPMEPHERGRKEKK